MSNESTEERWETVKEALTVNSPRRIPLALEALAELQAELRTLQAENEAMRIDQEVTHNEAFAYQQQIGRLRTALDDARGLPSKWREWAASPGVVFRTAEDRLRLCANELEAALQSSPMNEEPK